MAARDKLRLLEIGARLHLTKMHKNIDIVGSVHEKYRSVSTDQLCRDWVSSNKAVIQITSFVEAWIMIVGTICKKPYP